ncbi:MAG: radical SAM family heme chaperone HemW [Firmicutes bacterium]|nr:radical SAM family heme chaperone HemW [Bacillota bacterium]
MTTNNLGLYIHIPFCRQKCKYCDFLSFPCTSEQVYREYVTALCMEMESRREDCQGREVDTVFIGGGTPSLLQPEDFRRMMDSIQSNFHLAEETEITIETNPNSISQQKLDAYLENGVNRISIGIQSFDNQILHRLGRLHDKNEAFQKIQMVRKSGFTNINIDLMFGIPEQAMKTWLDTIRQGIFLGPQHISLYSLQLEKGTPLYKEVYEDKMFAPTPEIIDREMYHEAITLLKQAGYVHYEISNTAFPGKESRHNLKYWSYEAYLGLGPGASSFFGGKRFKNHEKMNRYIDSIKKREVPMDERSIEHYSDREEMGIYVFTGLRKKEGISLDDFRSRFDVDLFTVYDPAILKRHKGLINLYNNQLYLTDAGMDVSNTVMAEFV